MDVNLEQEENAHSPIVVTLFGIVMDVKERHPLNAYFPIVVIPSEIVTFLIEPFDASHGLAEEFSKSIIFPVPVKDITPVFLFKFQLIDPMEPDVKEEQ